MSRGLSPTHTMQAIVPPVVHSNVHYGVIASSKSSTSTHDPAIEPHVAILAFRAVDYRSSHGWPPSGWEKHDGMLYVRLDHEHITVNGSTPTAWTTNRTDIKIQHVDELALPHLKQGCSVGELLTSYQPPAYSGAIAVIDFPGATVDTCDTPQGRIDTRVYLDGDLTINATKNGTQKEIHLNAGARVFFANVPQWMVDDKPQPVAGMYSIPHYAAYAEMFDSESTCPIKPVPANYGCSNEAFMIRPPSGPSLDDVLRATSFECSNTQYP